MITHLKRNPKWESIQSQWAEKGLVPCRPPGVHDLLPGHHLSLLLATQWGKLVWCIVAISTTVAAVAWFQDAHLNWLWQRGRLAPTCFPWTGHLKRAECEQLLQVEASSSALSLQWVLPSHQCCDCWQTCQKTSSKACSLCHLSAPELAAEESGVRAVETLLGGFVWPIVTVHLQYMSNIENKYSSLDYTLQLSTFPSQRNLRPRQISSPWLVQGNKCDWGKLI